MWDKSKIKRFIAGYWEILGDALLIFLGAFLIYIFLMIEILGYYGQEQNVIVRRIELFLGLPILVLGIAHLIRDLRDV